jgi:hypothetical protein
MQAAFMLAPIRHWPQASSHYKSASTMSKNHHKATTEILPQEPATRQRPVQCWALCRNQHQCRSVVTSREGEPIPIPYCNTHFKFGDYALKIIEHPLAGKCLVARYDLPPKYRMAFHGVRGRCLPCNREDRSISYYPPNAQTGSNYYPQTRTLRTDNYNGVLNPATTGDVLQYAAGPGPNERQNIRSVSAKLFYYCGKKWKLHISQKHFCK